MLAAHPEWAESIYSELQEISDNGELHVDSLQRMKKLDSFLRESLRFNGAGLSNALSHTSER